MRRRPRGVRRRCMRATRQPAMSSAIGATPYGRCVEWQAAIPSISRAIEKMCGRPKTLVAGETVGRVVNRDDQSRRAPHSVNL